MVLMRNGLAFALAFVATVCAVGLCVMLGEPVVVPVSHEGEVRDFMRSVSAWEHECR